MDVNPTSSVPTPSSLDRGPRKWLVGAVLLAVPILLLCLAAPRLGAGAALERVSPVIHRMRTRTPMPPGAPLGAAALLAHERADPEAMGWRGEMLAAAPADRTRLVSAAAILEGVLLETPANLRAWTSRCETLADLGRPDAARCLEQALALGPYDFFVAHRRVSLAARLWPALDAQAREAAVRQVKLLWRAPPLRDDLALATYAPDERALLQRSFADEPETIRDINRYVTLSQLNRAVRRQRGLPRSPGS
jgi:hypothetical protein